MLSCTAPNLSLKVSPWLPGSQEVASGNSTSFKNPPINISSQLDDMFLPAPPINAGTTYQPSFQLRADPNDSNSSALAKSIAGISDEQLYKADYIDTHNDFKSQIDPYIDKI